MTQIYEYCNRRHGWCDCSSDNPYDKYESLNLESDEIIEEILGLDIKVKTNKNKERTICFTDLINSDHSTLTFTRSDSKPSRQIVVDIKCDRYLIEIK